MYKINTIYALSSANGKSAVAVFRISGENCIKILKKYTKIKNIRHNKPMLLNFYKNKQKEILVDKCVINYLKEPNSYTGEDCIEISTHGSQAVLKSMLQTLGNSKLCRIAEPGEFTRKSFENDKMDLTQAEAVADLISAETEAQKNQALGHLEGNFIKIINSWSQKIKNILANAEATIDFSDEEIPNNLIKKIKKETQKLINEINKYLDDNKVGENIRSGFKIMILGKPNTGKSSLINYLAKRELAIVSKTPGTTRDLIELNYDIKGLPVIFYDTAGLRKVKSKIEKYGIEKAQKKAINSSINIILINNENEISKYKKNFNNIIFAQPKSDKSIKLINNRNIIKISSKTGKGVNNLLIKIYNMLKTNNNPFSYPYISRERHREIIKQTAISLEKSIKIKQIDIIAEEIRSAYNNLGKISGKSDINEILDIIFSEFCIGK